MDNFAEVLLSVLGKNICEDDVRRLIEQHGLDDSMDDPPFRRYLGSPTKGVDLLLENDIVVEVQFHVVETKQRAAFAGALPLGVKAGMDSDTVHEIAGTPLSSDEFDSKYLLKAHNANMNVVYGKDGTVMYVSVGV